VRDIHVPDLTGKHVVVTGANSGIGLGAATRLAAAGVDVVLAVRDEVKGAAAVAGIRAAHPSASVRVERLDLSSLDSVESFAERMRSVGWFHAKARGATLRRHRQPD
jgi:NAD(P)-dependent dehydrogenase (short-subunit alcohol dehydrogenase family)